MGRWQGATSENIGQYVSEEQRSQARGPQRARQRVGVEEGCIAGRMQLDFHHGLLRFLVRMTGGITRGRGIPGGVADVVR